MKTNIIIVDDHTLVSNAIADLINGFKHFEVTNQYRNGQELIDKLAGLKKQPNIILLDINMPIMNGFETMDYLKINHPAINVLALSMNDDETSIIKMMKAGAKGYISKIVKEEELMNALEHVVAKGFYYTEQVTNLVFSNFQKKEVANVLVLTERERELLNYISTDLTYKEIAEKMFVSPKTIDGYREDLFQKFDVKSRIGLVMFAIKNKLIEID
jgi:DNA-binding NarL/FixJ family response regulator